MLRKADNKLPQPASSDTTLQQVVVLGSADGEAQTQLNTLLTAGWEIARMESAGAGTMLFVLRYTGPEEMGATLREMLRLKLAAGETVLSLAEPLLSKTPSALR